MTSNPIESLDSEESKDQIEFVNLKSKEGIVFKVSRRDAIISDLVKVAIEGDKDATEVPLLSVNTLTLKFIVEYMGKKKGDATVAVSKPLKQTMIDSCTEKWEAEFIDKVYTVKQNLRDLVLASNYMAINPLLELSCARIALGLKGKSKSQMIDELKC